MAEDFVGQALPKKMIQDAGGDEALETIENATATGGIDLLAHLADMADD